MEGLKLPFRIRMGDKRNLDKLFADVAVYNARIMGPAHAENVIDLACCAALSFRGVAHIAFPVDIQSIPAERMTPWA